MCSVSMVGDHYAEKWRHFQPTVPVPSIWVTPHPGPFAPSLPVLIPVSRQEFDELKRDVLEMKALLKRAKEYDERNGEPGCEMETKMALLRKVAAAVGIDLDDILKPASASTQ